jgi:hypothetical protein
MIKLILLCITSNLSFANLTRDEVNQFTDHDPKTMVYYLRDSNYDNFINYNDLVLAVFHEAE